MISCYWSKFEYIISIYIRRLELNKKKNSKFKIQNSPNPTNPHSPYQYLVYSDVCRQTPL